MPMAEMAVTVLVAMVIKPMTLRVIMIVKTILSKQNRYSALAHQPDPEPPSFHETRSHRDRTHSTTSHHSATVDQKMYVLVFISQISPKGLRLFSQITIKPLSVVTFFSDRVRKDMREWQESGQWPLSCYAPFVTEPCLDGMDCFTLQSRPI